MNSHDIGSTISTQRTAAKPYSTGLVTSKRKRRSARAERARVMPDAKPFFHLSQLAGRGRPAEASAEAGRVRGLGQSFEPLMHAPSPGSHRAMRDARHPLPASG